MPLSQFLDQGFLIFPATRESLAWVEAARAPALAALEEPGLQHWWRHGNTWFVGVDALPNDAEGRVAGGPALSGPAIDFITGTLQHPHPASHRAQVSVCRPGYPQRDAEESEAAHRFRLTRDAAHVDGLHGEGTPKRRFMRERHDFILGLALEDGDEGAAPFTLWEGSHHVMGPALRAAYEGLPPAAWPDLDVTEAYTAARAQAFQRCPRRPLPLRKGEALLVHRFALHGVAPWRGSPLAQRAIVYFRPAGWSDQAWLTRP